MSLPRLVLNFFSNYIFRLSCNTHQRVGNMMPPYATVGLRPMRNRGFYY